MRLRTAVFAVLVTTLAVITLIVPAVASADGRVGLRPAAGAPGDRVTLEGSGFPPSKTVTISIGGARNRTVKSNRGGAFRARLTLPRARRGWVTIVSHSGRKRVVNKFFATGAGGADQVIEVSSSTGGRIRLSPTNVTPGATLQLRGTGFPAGKRLRLSWAGTDRKVTARRGRFAASAVLPDSLFPGTLSGLIVGQGVRLLFHLDVASLESPVTETPPVTDAGLNPPPSPAPNPTPTPKPAPTPPPPPPPTPPSNTTPPGISGNADKGQTLTANPGVWSGTAPITFSYQWESCTGSTPSCSNVSGATNQTFTIPNSSTYESKYFRVKVTAKNIAGSATAIGGPSGVVPVPPPPPLSGTPVAIWHMDDTAGGMVDATGSGHNGILHSISLDGFGLLGSAYAFNGGSYVDVPSAADLNPAGSFTLRISMKTTKLPPPEDWDLIRKGIYPTSPSNYKMEYYPNGQAFCGFRGTGGKLVELKGGPALNDGAWHTMQCVQTSTQTKLVVDGATVATGATVGAISNSEPLVVGSHAGSSEFFQGSLDEASFTV